MGIACMHRNLNNKVLTNHPKLWLSALPQPTQSINKYTRGYSVIVGGFPMTGASRLASLAAARIGSGITTLIVPDVAFNIYASQVLSIIVRPFNKFDEFNHHIQDPRIQCFLIGPGLGITEDSEAQVISLLKMQKPIVLDADAISIFAAKLPLLAKHIKSPCVMTPHEGEFQRLFELSADRIKSVQSAAKSINAVIVLKGSETIIAAPNGNTIINKNAPAILATGGSGDVLAGMMTGLISQGMPVFDAAAAAVWIHAEAANQFGLGLIADDLPNMIPAALKALYTNTA